MKKIKTQQWEVVAPNIIGDFKKEKGPYFGCVIDNEHKYHFGRFNSEKKEDGLIAVALEKSVQFGKYENGKLVSPNIEVYPNGNITLFFKKEENQPARELRLDFSDSSFRYCQVDDDGVEDGTTLYYDGRTGSVLLIKYEHGKTILSFTADKKFHLRNPMKSDAKLEYPTQVDFDLFDYFNKPDYTYVNNSIGSDVGIGVMTVHENLYAVGFWKGKERRGFQICYYDNYFSVNCCHANEITGPNIDISDDGIFIAVEKEDGNGQNIHSGILAVKKDYIYLNDSTTNSIEFGDPAFIVENFDKLSFDDKGDGHLIECCSFNDIIEKNLKKEEKKAIENSDPNDPEYKMLSLIGQEDAKKEFKRIRAYIQKNDTSNSYKNIVFMGENGVGKSTVGRLISEILYKYNAISENDYTECSAKELYNNFTGSTKENIDNFVKQGKGGVILIDDLHYLDALNNSNVNEGLYAISRAMEENPDTVFILCDNKYNMNQILENNPTLFQGFIRFRVNFKDFTREELKEILNLKLTNKGYTIEPEAMDKLLEIIFLSKAYGNNINASAAISILEEIIVIQNVRTELINDKTITKQDIDVYVVENDIAFIDQKTGYQSDARKKLDELVGLEKIKETVDDLIAYFSINRGKKVDFHMCFSGNPGTGKTEVARIIGKLLRQEGILPTSKFLEVTRKDLIGQYIGSTAIITRDIIDKAMGGVLYIDEAYSLAYGTDSDGGGRDFGKECIAELLKAMEDRRGEFCVVLAGYTSEMKKLFDMNPGFKSRIKFDLEFPDYSDEELEKIARLFLKRDNANMSDENIKFLVKIVSIQRNFPNFANVRTLREDISKVQIKHARRVRLNPDDPTVSELTREDIINAFSKEEVELVLNSEKEINKVPSLNPATLQDLSSKRKPEKFENNKALISESILALKMGEGKRGEGTGFIISKDGYFLTCAHCVNGADSIKARRRISHHGHYIDLTYDASVVSIDKKADIALCKLNADENEEFDYLVLADKGTQLDKLSKVYLMGYPFGVSRFDELSINEGKIASYQKGVEDNLNQINLDIQAKGGNSGSPIIDAETSSVIGVLCGSSLSYGSSLVEEINYARPIDYVWNMLEKEFKENN